MTKKENELPATPKPETVEVDKAKLDAILSKMEEQDKEIKKLNSIADKSRLANYERRHGEKAPTRYKVSTFDGKIVKGWRMVKDEVAKSPAGVWYEHQEYQLLLEDETTHNVVGYNKFADLQYNNQIEVKELSKNISPEATILEVKSTVDGKIFKIDSRFVN